MFYFFLSDLCSCFCSFCCLQTKPAWAQKRKKPELLQKTKEPHLRNHISGTTSQDCFDLLNNWSPLDRAWPLVSINFILRLSETSFFNKTGKIVCMMNLDELWLIKRIIKCKKKNTKKFQCLNLKKKNTHLKMVLQIFNS